MSYMTQAEIDAQRVIGGAQTRAHFQSITDWRALEPSPAGAGYWKNYCTTGSGADTKTKAGCLSWFGSETREAGIQQVTGGWKEGAERAIQTLGKLEVPMVASTRRKQVWGRDGDEVNMDRVRTGNLDIAWRGTERNWAAMRGHANTYKLLVDQTTGAFTSAESFYWRGAVACALADSIEQSGRSVEIVAYIYLSRLGNNGATFLSYTVKQAGAPLDIAEVAACCAHPLSYRWFGFKAKCATPGGSDWGMGSVAQQDPPLDDDEKDGTPGAAGRFVIRNVWTEAEAKRYMATAVKRLEEGDGQRIDRAEDYDGVVTHDKFQREYL